MVGETDLVDLDPEFRAIPICRMIAWSFTRYSFLPGGRSR